MSDRRRNGLILLLVLGLLIASGIVIATQPTREGLDLKGGVQLVYQGKPTPQQPKVTQESLDRAVDIIRERVDQLGVSEPEIQRAGSDQIEVGLPDVKNARRAEQQVGKVAQLYFYDWEANVLGPDGKPHPGDQKVTGGPAAGTLGVPEYQALKIAAKRPPANQGKATTGTQWYLVNDKTQTVLRGPEEERTDLFSERGQPAGTRVVKVNPGTILIRADTGKTKGPKPDRWYVLNDNPSLKGTDITNPEQNFDQGQQPNVTFSFTESGAAKWHNVTRKIGHRPQALAPPHPPRTPDAREYSHHFAAVLDNEAITVPYISYVTNPDGIQGSDSEISGNFTIQSAQDLANLLKTGALPIKLELISQSQVSATLGKQALHQGLIAGIVGLGVVILFLLLYYRLLGVIATVGLAIYAIYFFALIKLIPITLTLPGIAGLILTIGVAADANIVIFERVKEEIRGGKSIPAGIATGYKKGLSAIIDANVVTFMVAFILFILAVGGVRGFAFVLGIGTLASLFTAVLATSAILGTLSRSRVIDHKRAVGAGERHSIWRNFDFMGASKWFFSFSGCILLIGALAIGGKGLNFGIDFESGTKITAALVKPATEQSVANALQSAGVISNPEVQKVTGKGTKPNTFQVRTSTLRPDQVTQATKALDGTFGLRGSPDTTSVGPSFGETVARSAIVAILASLLVISVYIALRFEWKYAVPVLIALMHDLLITAGVYSLTGREVTASTVAALLTILGYSLYDTIIVFDRIRENVPRMPRAAFSQIVNRSMGEVLQRSLATSFCTALPILSLLLFGGDTLKDFAFALLIGTISGAYSSVFIASPVLTHWKEREPNYEKRAERIYGELGQVPAYATAVGGAPVDVAPKEKPAKRRSLSDEPEELSAEEFQELVRDLPAEEVERPQRTVTQPRPPKVQRPPAAPEPEPDGDGDGVSAEDRTRDLSPDEVVMPKSEGGTKGPKQR